MDIINIRQSENWQSLFLPNELGATNFLVPIQLLGRIKDLKFKKHNYKNLIIRSAILLMVGTWNQPNVFAQGVDQVEVNKLDNMAFGFSVETTGGLSGGYFYASEPGPNAADSEFLLSNLLLEISSGDQDLPVGFVFALGETSTPSVLDTPQNNNALSIEYASLTITPFPGVSIETGLLMPNSGYEATYTYENQNILLGAVASQQPYNAYGTKIGFEIEDLYIWAGYYRDRLDNEEYDSADEAWEIGVCATVFEIDINLYHYHIGGFRQLTGVSIERTFRNVDIGLDLDYWAWAGSIRNVYGSNSSIGGAVYVSPTFGSFSIPVRLEYVHQEESQIYLESINAERIFTATVTPTYHCNENTFVRVETAYVQADTAFAGKNGNTESDTFSLAMEVGFFF